MYERGREKERERKRHREREGEREVRVDRGGGESGRERDSTLPLSIHYVRAVCVRMCVRNVCMHACM